jgi:hypothetical protein
MSNKKTVRMIVELVVPKWMTPAQARREVRSLINDMCGYMSSGPDGQEISLRARKVTRETRS